MVVFKTKKNTDKFFNDLRWITINKKRPLRLSGSFRTKEYGDVITDIDLTAFVRYNSKLLDIIRNILYKNRTTCSPFTFLHMSIGSYVGYELPWSIDNKGGCDFELDKAKKWYEWFRYQNLVSQETLKYIKEKIFSPGVIIRDLIDIENILKPYSRIVWTEKDIQRGFIIHDEIRYNLLELFKTKTPVLKYIYHVENEKYILVDVGLVDKRINTPIYGKMYRYYTKEWYKILKSLRWKLDQKYTPLFFEVIKGVELLIALKYQLDLLIYAERVGVLPIELMHNILSNTIKELKRVGFIVNTRDKYYLSQMIYDKVNMILKDKILDFLYLVSPETQNTFLSKLIRGTESYIPTSQEDLRKRRQSGIKCPFFSTDIDEYEELVALSIRMDIFPRKLIDCFTIIAQQQNKRVKELMSEVIGKNNMHITEMNNRIILRKDNILQGTYELDYKPFLQAYILLHNQ